MDIWSEEYKRFRGKLKEARLSATLSQVDAAKSLRKKQSYISKCESGERRVDIIELKRFAKLYNKSISYFAS